MADAEELIVRIKADITELQKGLKDASSATTQSTNEMKNAFSTVKDQLMELVPALSVAAVVEFSKGALEAADNLYIMGQRSGIAADTLSKLNIPLKQNGSSVDEFTNSMKFMSRNIEEAAEGNPKLIATFDSLGLSVTKLQSLTPEEQFNAISNALYGVTDQGKFVNDGMTLMGRNFTSIAPLIKAASGNMGEFVDKMDGLTKEEIDKVHELDDKWTKFYEGLKMHAVESTLAVVNAFEFMHDHIGPPGTNAKSGGAIIGSSMINPLAIDKGSVSTDRPAAVNMATFLGKQQYGPKQQDKSGKGNNSDIDTGSGELVDEQLPKYIESLKGEAAALSLSKEQLVLYKAEQEGAAKALADYNADLRDSPDLTKDETAQIDAASAAYYNQQKAMESLQKQKEKDIQVQAQMEHEISSSLASIALNYKSFGQTISDVMKKIADQIIEQDITNPLVSSLGTALTGTKTVTGVAGGSNSLFSGLFSFLPKFANGGQVSGPSIVGENGPELFIPGGKGTIVPNGGFGGSNVTVMQTINLSPGLAETVNASIMNAAPKIAAAAHAGVMQSLQKGGAESRIVGKRS